MTTSQDANQYGRRSLSPAMEQYLLRQALMRHYRASRSYQQRITLDVRPRWRAFERALDGREPFYLVRMRDAAHYFGASRWQRRVPEQVVQVLVSLGEFSRRAGREWGAPTLMDALNEALMAEDGWQPGAAHNDSPRDLRSPFAELRTAAAYYTSYKDSPEYQEHPVIAGGPELVRYVQAIESIALDTRSNLTQYGGVPAGWATDFIHGDGSSSTPVGGGDGNPYDPNPPFNPFQLPLTIWVSLSTMFGAVGHSEPDDPADFLRPEWQSAYGWQVAQETEPFGFAWDDLKRRAHTLLNEQLADVQRRFESQHEARYMKAFERQVLEDVPHLYAWLVKRAPYEAASFDRLLRLADLIGVDFPTAKQTQRRERQRGGKRKQRMMDELFQPE